jgi:YcaO-like protein with predicted kinase domain
MNPMRLAAQDFPAWTFAADCLQGASARSISPAHDRCIDAASTLANVTRHFPMLGITRLGELTGLDTLGIAVAFATRPNSYSLSLSLGKGASRELALTSAAMEAAELAVAERRPAELLRASVSGLRSQGREIVDLSRIARCQPHLLEPDADIDWVEGRDLFSGQAVLVPWALAGLDHRIDPPGYHNTFEVATDGLASGNSEAEAVLHGIYELIERYAYALHELVPAGRDEDRYFVPVCSGQSDLGCMLDRIREAGLTIELVDMTTDIGVPCHLAMLSMNSGGRDEILGASPQFVGCGSHRNPLRSITRAVTEAVQARAAFIAGARDDFQSAWRGADSDSQVPSHSGEARPLRRADLAEMGRGEAGSNLTAGEHIAQVLSALQSVGIEQAIAVTLSVEAWGFHVVRMLIPDLQIPLHGERSQVTTRGLRRVMGAMA